MAKFISPSQATLDKLIETSEWYNNPHEHYKVMTELSTYSQTDASGIISKLTEKNEFGNPINKMVSMSDKKFNRAISQDPVKYEKDLKRSNDSSPYISKLRNQFRIGIIQEDYGSAAIAYLTLKNDLKDKRFLSQISENNEKVKPFLEWLKAQPGKPEGAYRV